MNNTLKGINDRLDTAEEKISDPEDIDCDKFKMCTINTKQPLK